MLLVSEGTDVLSHFVALFVNKTRGDVTRSSGSSASQLHFFCLVHVRVACGNVL